MNDDPRIQRHFATLPEPELPHRLWTDLRQARERGLRRRRALRTGATLAVLLAVGLAGMKMLMPPPEPPYGSTPVVSTVPPSAENADPHQARLRALDRDLQAAYARGASDAELQPLWDERNALIRNLTHPMKI